MTDKQNWMSINNWVPIITSTVMIVLAFGGILTKLAVMKEQLTELRSDQTVMIELFKSVEERYGIMALKVERLETLQSIK